SLCDAFSRIDACEINLLRAGGQCLAGQFCLVFGDTSYVLKIGYEESYANVAPGNMLLEHSMRRHGRGDVIKYLSLVTDTPWHANWKPLSHPVSTVYVFNTIPMGLAAFGLLRGEHYLRRRYKAQLRPLVEQWQKFRGGRSSNKHLDDREPGAGD